MAILRRTVVILIEVLARIIHPPRADTRLTDSQIPRIPSMRRTQRIVPRRPSIHLNSISWVTLQRLHLERRERRVFGFARNRLVAGGGVRRHASALGMLGGGPIGGEEFADEDAEDGDRDTDDGEVAFNGEPDPDDEAVPGGVVAEGVEGLRHDYCTDDTSDRSTENFVSSEVEVRKDRRTACRDTSGRRV